MSAGEVEAQVQGMKSPALKTKQTLSTFGVVAGGSVAEGDGQQGDNRE